MKSAFVIAAPSSGSGKTTVTLSIMAALRKRGIKVQPFKTGPDYIDTAHHALVTGMKGENLDTWMLPRQVNEDIFSRAMGSAEVGVVEGVMGLYDGVDGKRDTGSTASLAALLGLPVILVVDARSMARSAAAIVSGFVNFSKELNFAGVIWNRVGSPNHLKILDEALASANLPHSLGAYGRRDDIAIPSRHLGLVTPEDMNFGDSFLTGLSTLAEESVDIDKLLASTNFIVTPRENRENPTPRLRVAVPRDRAYSFYYEENLRQIESLGGELLFFAPTEGDALPPGVDAVYLGGGYPELHAEKISANKGFIEGLRNLHRGGKPIYGECGGFMTMCEEVEDPSGRRWPMAGIFPTRAKMTERGFRLGYREVDGKPGTKLAGITARGHEFHYSKIEAMPEDVKRVLKVKNARGEVLEEEGFTVGSASGGYIHLAFGSNPEIAKRLLGLG
ncbi:MAG: cobyrinate a,c-diamide synthase [Deltaproteobacteria bacterium]|nr:MAG: cobyrinate a,c-diamide synthase [Deltaproteobacteria bacterium]